MATYLPRRLATFVVQRLRGSASGVDRERTTTWTSRRRIPDTDRLVDRVIQSLLERQLVKAGDKFVMAFGSPAGQRTPTNAIGVISV